MIPPKFLSATAGGLLFCAVITSASAAEPTKAAQVTQERAVDASEDSSNWLLHGGTYSEQRFSPLDQINADNVSELGLAWFAEIPSIDGLVATPLVVDGVIYMTTSFANVLALDGKTGKILWQFDPEVRVDFGFGNSWASRVNRGVAAWHGKLYVGTGDCRLVAIDATLGTRIWETKTCDPEGGYGITGAPRVANGNVYIGNFGADMGARGYVDAYDAETGELVWRFYTMPGDPSEGYSSKAMAKAAKTWTGDIWWKNGGASVWDAIVYDPELNQLYVGTDSAPLLPNVRSPEGGDNLFTCSIVALDADTGEYRWHYQTVPADAWHYDAAMHIVLAELKVGGKKRKVLMQAPKNGFFYVVDREKGELISANNFVPVNWATHVDLASGRPVELPGARFYETARERAHVTPSGIGGHNWHPMSYSPKTGLVYIPVHEYGAEFRVSELTKESASYDGYGVDPDDTVQMSRIGKLIAWDPKTQSLEWEAPHTLPMNGGVLSTAGDLVFQGTATGEFHAYDAATGKRLWRHAARSSVQAPPIGYEIDDQQYVLLPVGWGGAARLGLPKYGVSKNSRGPSRLLAYKLGGKSELPHADTVAPELPKPPDQTASEEKILEGERLFHEAACAYCHGVGAETIPGGSVPDLRYLTRDKHVQWHAIVLGGSRRKMGMIPFHEMLSVEDSAAIQAYVIEKARKAYEERAPATDKPQGPSPP